MSESESESESSSSSHSSSQSSLQSSSKYRMIKFVNKIDSTHGNDMYLILGNGKLYEKNPSTSIRCSPIPVENWISKDRINIDYDINVRPDIIYDLRNSIWNFAENDTFCYIIDTSGIALKYHYKDILPEICRILKDNGIFYGNKITYQKINNSMNIINI